MPNHKRKRWDEREVGAYTQENLCKAVQDVYNGDKTTKEAKKEYGPSIRTIIYRGRPQLYEKPTALSGTAHH